MWLVAVAGAELDENGHCNLLDEREGFCVDILADGDCIDICVAQVEVGGTQRDGSILEAGLKHGGMDLSARKQGKIGHTMPRH